MFRTEITTWLLTGRSVIDTYIYFKDYITLEQVQEIAQTVDQ